LEEAEEEEEEEKELDPEESNAGLSPISSVE
jgi:hypothetical protein